MVRRGRYAANQLLLLLATFLILLCWWNLRQIVSAPAVDNVAPQARLSFTFDDGLTTSLAKAAPILARYGFRATDFVITNCVGTAGICPANTDTDYMTWNQIGQLHQQYGWEIGSHTVTHPALGEVSIGKQEHELADSKIALAQHGYTATSFASPYGDYSNQTLALAAKYYQVHRGFWDIGYNYWPYNEYLLKVQQIQSNISVSQAESFIDHAIQDKQWVIFVFHDIKDRPSTNPDDFEYATDSLNQIAHYAKQRQIAVTTIGQNPTTSSTNLLANASFNDGLTGGWTTDTPHNVGVDCHDHGSYPDPHCSVRLTSGNASSHLFSPALPVQPAMTYVIKSFLDVIYIDQGEVGYYIDEYNSNGHWISGQWKSAEHNTFVENINFTYRPTSRAVRYARLQLFLTPRTHITAYADTFQWYPVGKQ
jgi:peptidoglycan/xylan/chitin deacetylase (PgdA/CDA1 family)